MSFLPPNQQRQSTEETWSTDCNQQKSPADLIHHWTPAGQEGKVSPLCEFSGTSTLVEHSYSESGFWWVGQWLNRLNGLVT